MLRAIYYPGNRVLFFDNGAYKGTFTTNLPTGTLSDLKLHFRLTNTSSNDRLVKIYMFEYKDMKVV